jgi:hypothetical protein
METEKKFLGVRELVLTAAQLESVQFEDISPVARRVLENSNTLYKNALLSSKPEEYQEAALRLASGLFQKGK